LRDLNFSKVYACFRDLEVSAVMPASASHCPSVPVTPTLLSMSQYTAYKSAGYFKQYARYHEKYHAQKLLLIIFKNPGSQRKSLLHETLHNRFNSR
jgi:hypothetical protein